MRYGCYEVTANECKFQSRVFLLDMLLVTRIHGPFHGLQMPLAEIRLGLIEVVRFIENCAP